MKVLFLNMPVREDALPNNVPLGIYYLIAALREFQQEGGFAVECKVVDLNAYRPVMDQEDLELRIGYELPADVVCLSGLITTLRAQRQVAELVRRLCPTAKIVSGGGLATNLGTNLLTMIPELNAVCIGEGEESIKRIVRDVAGRDLQARYQWPVSTLTLSPAWDAVFGLDMYVKNPIWGTSAKNSSYSPVKMDRSLNMITSRGCPYRCAFCSHEATGGGNYRMRGVRAVVDEMLTIAWDNKLDFVGFVDDNVGVYAVRLAQICEMLRDRHNTTKWGAHVRFNHVDNTKLLEEMYGAGCRYLGFGGESADTDILTSMRKGNHLNTMIRVMRECRAVGIHPNATWMMGWPGETREQVRTTAKFILEHAPENPHMFVATAYPGTDLWDMVKDKVLLQFGTIENYVMHLGDATLPLVNYSAMPDSEFQEVAEYARTGELERI